MSEKVKKSTLQIFIDKRGYEFVSKNEKGDWRGVAEASRETGLGEMTIRRLLRLNPTEPSKGEAKYVAEFEQTQGYQMFKDRYGKTKKFEERAKMIRDAWLLLNKKDPSTWNHDDYQVIWTSDRFFRKEFNGREFNGVPEGFGSAFHNLMRVTKKSELLGAFKGKKYPKGGKTEWFLEDEDIIQLCGESGYEDNENLLTSLIGISVGGRWSSINLVTPENLNPKDLIISMYEPKRQEFKSRLVIKPVMDLIEQYIRDYNIQPKEPLFPHEYDFYLTSMKAAGKRCGIRKTISTHILKHTFVTQAHRHGVSAENIVEQTGTDWETLKKHYRARDEKKMRHELLGEAIDVIPFPTWLNGLMPSFRAGYERIKNRGISDGVRARL